MSGSAFHPDLLTAGDFPVAFGRYRLLGLLGEGGMARVFRAELEGPEGFRKPAAIKIIRGAVAARGESLRTSLIHEARLGGLLSHPNIVSTLDFGEHDGHLFIAMDLVEGWTLDEALSLVGAFPADVALEVTAQICEGLDHAHRLQDRGVATDLVHRDLKPSNVIIDHTGRVRVMDFGIAKATNLHGNTTVEGQTKGTPTYMSPEQAMGKPVDNRSDLFAVGALLFELMSGRRLFVGDTLAAVMYSVIEVEAQLADPATFAPLRHIAGLEEVVVGCLRADPDARFAHAADLEDALREVQEGLSRRTRLRSWVREVLGPAAGDPALAAPDESSRPPTTAPTRGPADELPTPAPTPALISPTRLVAAQAGDATIDDEDEEEEYDGGGVPKTRAMPAGARGAVGVPWGALAVAAIGLVVLLVFGVLALRLLSGASDEGTTAEPAAPSPDVHEAASPRGSEEPILSPYPTDAEPAAAEQTDTTPAATSSPAAAPGPGTRPAPTPSQRAAVLPGATADPAVAVSLEHQPPPTVTVGTPVGLRVRLEPADAGCTPRVSHGPSGGATGSYDSTPMTAAGAGQWAVRLPVPYAEEYRTGIRYRIRCVAADGRVVATWPEQGLREVPALAR